jgi:hypothetical protein
VNGRIRSHFNRFSIWRTDKIGTTMNMLSDVPATAMRIAILIDFIVVAVRFRTP